MVARPRMLRVALYPDGAGLADMDSAMRRGGVEGSTTNPTLSAKAGVRVCREFGREAVRRVGDLTISFEVLGDDLESIGRQAHESASGGENVYVKIPICTARRESTLPLIRELSQAGLQLNVTAVMTQCQVHGVTEAVRPDVPSIVSIFAGGSRTGAGSESAHDGGGRGVP